MIGLSVIPWYYKLAAGAVAGAALWAGGMLYERANLTEYRGEVKGAASAQVAATKAADLKIEGDYHASNEDVTAAVKAVHEYYTNNPNVVERVRVVNGKCTVSKAVSNSSGRHDTAGPSIADGYVSKYNPEACRLAAVRLDNLQRLLITDGVEVRK